MNPEGIPQGDNVTSLSAERLKRQRESVAAMTDKERLSSIALEIRSAATRKGAMREDYLNWVKRTAGQDNPQDEGVLDTSDAAVARAASDTLDYELALARNYSLEQVRDILSAFADPAKRELQPLMRYYAAARRYEELVGSPL